MGSGGYLYLFMFIMVSCGILPGFRRVPVPFPRRVHSLRVISRIWHMAFLDRLPRSLLSTSLLEGERQTQL